MSPNLCLTDRVIRAVVGIGLAAVGLLVVRGLLGIAVALVGALLAFSATLGFCHVYKFLGISTKGQDPTS